MVWKREARKDPTERDSKRGRIKRNLDAVALLEASAFFLALILFAIFVVILEGCSTSSVTLDPDSFYRRDIFLKVNGYYTKGGVIVIPKAPSYRIQGSIKGKFDFLSLKSCHRQFTIESEGGDFDYTYEPVKGIEDDRACPIEIVGVEKTKGRDSFGFIDFENDHDQLQATTACNGETKTFKGVGHCQAPRGLFERISFGTEVFASSVDPKTGKQNEACPFPLSSPDGKTFEFKIPKGLCLIKFMEKGEPNHTFRLNLLGYEDIIPRDL